jgi:hypothetical protein
MAFFGSTPTTGGAFSSSTGTSSGGFFGTAPKPGTTPYERTGFTAQGSVSSAGNSDSADDSLSGYHFVQVSPNTDYTITANRLEIDLDPAMWVFADFNTFEDFLNSDTLSSGAEFDTDTLNYLGYADDEVPHPGPHGDPLVSVTSPDSGRLTIVVTNYASGPDDGGDGRFDYQLAFIPDDVLYQTFASEWLTTLGNGFFSSAADTGGTNFGQGPQVAGNLFEYSTASGVLVFDNADHSGDNGGQPIAGRGTGDEAANVIREFEALGYTVTATAATDAAALSQLLADIGAFVLPEAERGAIFPDADTLFSFVNEGGNLLFFGGSGAGTNQPQLNFINDAFGLDLTGAYGADGNYPLSPEALAEFIGGPANLGNNNGTGYLDMDSLPADATVIYGREGDSETVLVFMPQGDGNLVYLGWDYFDSPGQDNGWNDTFETVAELTAEIELAGVGVSNPAIGSGFFGFDSIG